MDVSTQITTKLVSNTGSCDDWGEERKPEKIPQPPTKAEIKTGYTVTNVLGTQGDVVELEKVSSGDTSSSFITASNPISVSGARTIFTDIALPGTAENPAVYNFEIFIYGGGVNGIEFCKTIPDNMVAYCQCPHIPDHADEEKPQMDDRMITGLTVYYTDAYKEYLKKVQADEKSQLVREKLDEQYSSFKKEILTNTPEDIYDLCYKIAAVEDMYFNLTENVQLSEAQKDYILETDENILIDFSRDWYEYGDYTEALKEHINGCWVERGIVDEENIEGGEEME